ncbi:MAG: IS110 family transposase, partial [Holosporales bacterium]|nr:IS110 family transposase [Holosporales bacterium]
MFHVEHSYIFIQYDGRVTHDSGTMKGYRSISGGRARVRKALYMASISAIKSNKVLKEFYMRLRGEGKPGKV